ncbi:DUF4157 domain-containing protein [Paeniglutamicibacter antarcticus]|uniref:DUF4157 domain-containing protein n=1 Tax=Arthrobacter terrae TaxID=2935737 RepID=A0A931CG36_9MICC|nr:DUF4157 domain-containing protein [Arthrobacter terrae]MBG0737932.1 DUF4157 domain-containing protein [Arthrobacter terrae]
MLAYQDAEQKSEGRPLDTATKEHYERGLNSDLSGVRLHTDGPAQLSAAGLGAQAFTSGLHIIFGAGRFDPASLAGRHLLGHELAHVVQQQGGSAGSTATTADAEAEAERAASVAAAGSPTSVHADRAGRLRGFGGDIRTMSITPQFARSLTDAALAEQLQILGAHLAVLPAGAAEFEAARSNQSILQEEQVHRLVSGQTIFGVGSTVQHRHLRFQQGVLLSARHRLLQNIENLAQWRSLIVDRLPAEALQTQVLAQSASDLHATATTTGGLTAFSNWSADPNPYRRNVWEHQVRGQWRACTGCHELVRADQMAGDESHTGPAWLTPADRLSDAAGLNSSPIGMYSGITGESSARTLAAIAAIRPIVAPLGDQGYRIIPDDVFSLRSGLTPGQLKETILAKLDHRRWSYAELIRRIANGDISYLQLGPVLQDLLPSTDAEVQQAVKDDIASEHRWSILKIAGTIILALLSILFPPLVLALAAIQFTQGYNTFKTGSAYNLGIGANSVFTRDQQDSGTAMMASGVFNMTMAAVTVAGAAPGLLDTAATRAITTSDLAVAARLGQRALQGPIPEAELLLLQQPGLVGRVALRWADMRQFQVLYRGQTAATAEILSPVARSGGVAASRSMYDAMKAQGMSDLEIAGLTAKWNNQPVPSFSAPPGMAGQPLGGVGIPTTRLPNIAADFAQPTGVIYVLRIPKGLAIPVGKAGWGAQSALEQEWVIFHQLPNGMVVRQLPGNVAPPLQFDYPAAGPSLAVPPATP